MYSHPSLVVSQLKVFFRGFSFVSLSVTFSSGFLFPPTGPIISKPPGIWSSMTKLDYWLLFFPDVYYQSIMWPEMSKKLDPGRPPIEWWEYLCWLGIWHLLATTDGHDRRSFWSMNDGDCWRNLKGPLFFL
jgi:hypothetical protein